MARGRQCYRRGDEQRPIRGTSHAAASKKYRDIASPSNSPVDVERPDISPREQRGELRPPPRNGFDPSRAQRSAASTASAATATPHPASTAAPSARAAAPPPDPTRPSAPRTRARADRAPARAAPAASENRRRGRSSPARPASAAPPAPSPSTPRPCVATAPAAATPSRPDAAAQQRRHEQIHALRRIERHHAERIADAKRARARALRRNPPPRAASACGEPKPSRPTRPPPRAPARRALPIHAHEPVAANVAQARAQVEPARIRPVVETHVRDEFLPGAEARRRMRAGPPAADRRGSR